MRATATGLPVRDSQQSAQQLFSFVALTNATLCVFLPSFPFRVRRVLVLSIIAGSGSLNPPGSDNC
jgi:hypothetical protein